ncbi:sporulation protein [Streptomyces cylindrosporus]|uniref:Sporulation protein n=1 Tax=Streptomyces cylindrosporus TaxID=2927583 RepID=A0ABS9Y5Q4_9ACTN|nr:sporulation protein [Streptomyces cylindrosporus]MCI3271261.1 sporulation protein [Streptomyces cylindrosporus]
MGFKRLFGIGDPDEAIEVDTQILGPVYPGAELRGEVLLRGGSRDAEVDTVYLRVLAQITRHDDELRDYEIEFCGARPYYFTLRKGEEKRLTFTERLSWETPVSEVGGRAVGVTLWVKTELSLRDGSRSAADNDLLHVSALPLHEAVLDAFAEEGYFCDSAHLVDSYIPETEQHRGFYETFVLTDRAPGGGRPEQLEVVFHTNPVGAMTYVRRAALDERDWADKPPTRCFPAAHHEVGQADWGPRVRKVLEELVLIESL